MIKARGNSRGNSRGKTAAKLQQKIAETKAKRANVTQKQRGLPIEPPSVKKGKRGLTQKKGRSFKYLTPEQMEKHEKRVAKREQRKETKFSDATCPRG